MSTTRFIVLHDKGKPFYVRADAILSLSARDSGTAFSIGTDFAQRCDETPQQVIDLIEAERQRAGGR